MTRAKLFLTATGYYWIAIFFFQGCGMTGSKSDAGRQATLPKKPSIDTSMVLEPVELYRAKRYESIQDAMGAGVENAHKLVLYGRKLGTLTPEIGKLVYLQSLDVADNDLLTLPPEIGNLHYLQGIYANLNRLTEFPGQLIPLPILKSIDLSDNQIAEIPPSIEAMEQLTRLSMDRNHLTRIPVEVYRLTNLAVLELSGNGVDALPEGLEDLGQLKKLDLSKNQLKSVPGGLSAMGAHLKELYLQGNQIPREDIDRLARALPNTNIRY